MIMMSADPNLADVESPDGNRLHLIRHQQLQLQSVARKYKYELIFTGFDIHGRPIWDVDDETVEVSRSSVIDDLSEMEGVEINPNRILYCSFQAPYKSGGVWGDILTISSFGALQKGNYTHL
jgi:hypothetical protein